MDRDWTASFSIRFRNGTCIIILDKKYNIENSSCHFGSYGSIWTVPSPQKILYGPQKLRSIYYFFCDGPVHILPYDPLSAMNYLLYIYHQYISVNILQWVRIRTYSVSGHESIWRNITKPKCNLNIQINDGSIENNSEQNIIIESSMSWQDISKLYNSLPLGMKDWYPPIHVKTYNTAWLPWIIY